MAFEYQMMIPPHPWPPFAEMTQAEATEHFEWFISQAASRLDQLKRAYAYETGQTGDLSMSRSSLISLWAWLAKHVAKRVLSTEEAAARQSMLPQWMQDAGIENRELSTPSLALATDAGFYLAAVFESEYPGRTRWALWAKRNSQYHNRPVLIGFGRGPLLPVQIIRTCMWGVIHGPNDKERLARVYDVWAKKLSSHSA